ncbi:hypothetical protein ACHAWF_014930 [Thalassiosira exigua]
MTMRSTNWGGNALAILRASAVSALLSGLVWYRIGVLHAGGGDPCASLDSGMRRLRDEDPEFWAPPPPSRSQGKAPVRRGNDDGGNGPPYRCGVVFFYHVPSTGGASINTWLRKYSNGRKGHNYSYFQRWTADFKGSKMRDIPTLVADTEAEFAKGMEEHVRNLGDDEWRIAHCHINSLHVNESEALLYEWRDAVEGKRGCKMVNAIMLRDPLSHTMSLHKRIEVKGSSRQEWLEFLKSPMQRGLWATNLDFLLYNKGRRNPHNVSKEEKVRRGRGMELLERHFEVVTVGNHGAFVDQVLNLTGWNHIEMPYRNAFQGELSFTKKEVEG